VNEPGSSESALETHSKVGPISNAIGGTRVFPSLPAASLRWEYPLELVTEWFAASAQGAAVTVFTLLAILTACTATLLIGLPQMTIYGHDISGFLDGGWRVLQGQAPHVDFYSAMGPVYYFLWAAGFKMAHNGVEGIVNATVLVGIVLGLWSFAIARNRLGALCATVCTVFLVCFWLAPFAIGDPFYQTTYAMQYNRLGYVLFLIIFIELFGVSGQTSSEKWEWGALSSGLALGLLLFLKANFFTVAIVPVAFAYLFRIKRSRHGLFLLAGFLAVLLPMSSYLHWHLGSFLADLRIAGAARASQKWLFLRTIIRVPSRNFITIAVFTLLSLLGQASPRGENKGVFPCLNGALLLLLLVLGCDFVLASSNMQASGFPLSWMAILLIADQLVRQLPAEERRHQWALATCLFVVVIGTFLPNITDLVNTWESETIGRFGRATLGPHFDAPHLAALQFKDHSDAIWGQASDNGSLMTGRVNDGIELLRNYTTSNERIACICFANPFSYALLRESPRGGSPFFDYGFNFNESSAPTAERIVGDAEVVIYPKADDDPPTIATLRRICEPILSKKYRQVAESEQWVLLRRIG
jgi:hypothetical protein